MSLRYRNTYLERDRLAYYARSTQEYYKQVYCVSDGEESKKNDDDDTLSLSSEDTDSSASEEREYLLCDFSDCSSLDSDHFFDDDDDDDDFDDLSSISSFDDDDMSLTSLASFDAKMDANEAMYYNAHRLVDYHSRFFCALGDANIQWGRRPLIADMQEQECIDDFRMKKIELQDFSKT